MIQHILGPAALPLATTTPLSLSVLSYNVLLPNSIDGWWNYKMYLPPLTADKLHVSSWGYRRTLIKDRIAIVDPDVVCFQEVCPESFEDDFAFMLDLGYDGKELFRKGRFRPATFWKTSRCNLITPAVHKDRTLLTAFRNTHGEAMTTTDGNSNHSATWYVLNVHLQAGPEGKRRVRQLLEGCRAIITLAKKLKEFNPEETVAAILCGDFNGGAECGAIRLLEDGFVDETHREDNEPVVSTRKDLPFHLPLCDVSALVIKDRVPPATLVVPELVSLLTESGDVFQAYANPSMSVEVRQRLNRIYDRYATQRYSTEDVGKVMNVDDVERWLLTINGKVGRGSEFRAAVRLMKSAGNVNGISREEFGGDETNASEAEKVGGLEMPSEGILSREDFISIYEEELRGGKFWGIAHDLAILGEPLPQAGIFRSRFDRIYCTNAVEVTAVMDFDSACPCPNEREPSDHLPIAASFTIRTHK